MLDFAHEGVFKLKYKAQNLMIKTENQIFLDLESKVMVKYTSMPLLHVHEIQDLKYGNISNFGELLEKYNLIDVAQTLRINEHTRYV